jgi:hypothetical protein
MRGRGIGSLSGLAQKVASRRRPERPRKLNLAEPEEAGDRQRLEALLTVTGRRI